jgi:hypothetical protein
LEKNVGIYHGIQAIVENPLSKFWKDNEVMQNDKEIKAKLDAVATLIKYESEGWIKMVTSSSTFADFKLDRLPPDDMMPNFVSMVCIEYKLSEYVHFAGLAGKYSLQPNDSDHILHIGDSATK